MVVPLTFFYWLLAALLLLVFEMGHPGLFFFLSFACGALLTALLSVVTTSYVAHVLFFVCTSVGAFFVLRRWVAKRYGHVPHKTNIDALIGKRGMVLTTVGSLQPGQVKLQGQVWSARPVRSDVIEVGTTVEVVAVSGCHLLVQKVVA